MIQKSYKWSLVIALSVCFLIVVSLIVGLIFGFPNAATSRGGEAVAGCDVWVRESDGQRANVCLEATATPTLQPTSTPTLTPIPPTLTPLPTNTPTLEPSPTATPEPSATPFPTANATATPVAEAGKECPAWVHDSYVTTGPDGKTYPTWHPQVDPTYGCYFAHTHGDDPRASTVIQTMPPFGYVGATGGFNEPHVGFKVFNFECGENGDQGQNQIASRFVMHMGTSGVGRYAMAFHSIQYDAVSCQKDTNGNPLWSVHLQGMADFGSTAPIGSVCDNPRQGGRDFSMTTCTEPGKPELAYEIWGGHFSVYRPGEFDELFQSRAYVQLVPALFDPITTANPNDLTQVIYTSDVVYPNGRFDPLSQQSPFRGCNMETYQGPLSINNRNRPTKYITNVFGVIQSDAIEGDPGTLVQTISAVRVDGAAANASANGQQFKKQFDFCSPFLHAPN